MNLRSQIGTTRAGCSSAFSAAAGAQELAQADKEKALRLLETSKEMALSFQLSGTSNLHPIAGPLLNAWSTSLPPKILSVHGC